MSPRVKLLWLIVGLIAASALATRQQLLSTPAQTSTPTENVILQDSFETLNLSTWTKVGPGHNPVYEIINSKLQISLSGGGTTDYGSGLILNPKITGDYEISFDIPQISSSNEDSARFTLFIKYPSANNIPGHVYYVWREQTPSNIAYLRFSKSLPLPVSTYGTVVSNYPPSQNISYKIKKIGSLITAYYSTDRATYTQLGEPVSHDPNLTDANLEFYIFGLHNHPAVSVQIDNFKYVQLSTTTPSPTPTIAPICSPATFIQDYTGGFNPNPIATYNFSLNPPSQIATWTGVTAWLLNGEWDDCGTLGTFTASCVANQTFKYPGPKVKIHTGNSPVPGTLTNTQISNASYAFWTEWQGTSCVTPTVTPTPSPTPTPVLTEFRFSFKFEGVSIVNTPNKEVLATFRSSGQPDQGFLVNAVSVSIDNGTYVYYYSTGSDIKLLSGTYDILLKGPAHLQRKYTNVTIPNQPYFTTNFNSVPLLPGDIAGGTGTFPYDNKVNLLDYGVLATEFDSEVSKISLADLNFDGKVNLLDYGLLAKNFNSVTTGDE